MILVLKISTIGPLRFCDQVNLIIFGYLSEVGRTTTQCLISRRIIGGATTAARPSLANAYLGKAVTEYLTVGSIPTVGRTFHS